MLVHNHLSVLSYGFRKRKLALVKQKSIYILGVGHSTPLTIELAEACGYKVAGLYHYQAGRTGELEYDVPIIGSHEDLFALDSLQGMQFALSMGDNSVRRRLAEKLMAAGGELPNLLHPSALISRSAKLGKGVCIEAFVVLQPNTEIGSNTIIRHHSVVCHNTRVGAHSFIAAHSVIGAYLELEESVFVGLGAIAISGKVQRIGENSVIGAGAVLTKEVAPADVMAGNPARPIKNKSR